MNMYVTPVEGMYNYKTPRFDGTFNMQQVKVLVLGESPKTYMIRLLIPLGNHKKGHELSVHKHNIHIRKKKEQPREYDYTDAWWQK